jgi:hypothetical protein
MSGIKPGNSRRHFLKAGTAGAFIAPWNTAGEERPGNIKLAHRVSARITDNDLLFLQQIGMKWSRVEFTEADGFDAVAAARDRFARYGMRIYSAVHPAYRSLNIQ